MIARTVERIVKGKPFIQEGLARGIIKHAALAEELIPAIEKELGRKATFAAVNMAVRRLSEKLEKVHVTHPSFDEASDILVQSNIVEIVLYKGELQDIERRMQEIYGIVNSRQGDFLTITQGLNEIMIITNEKHRKEILSRIPKRNVKKTVDLLSSVTLHIPPRAMEAPGMFYTVCRALAWENINIVDIVSTLTEMTFIVHEKDTARTYETFKTLIKK